MSKIVNMSRREFLQSGVLAGGGLLLGFCLPLPKVFAQEAMPPVGSFTPNAFIRIGTDDIVTVIVNKAEMGQGVYTSLPMLIAEEMEADWSKIVVEAAPVDPAYNHVWWGSQGTGGSTSVRSSWKQFRKAGATARFMLVAAAAEMWGVEAASCQAENGFVVHPASGRRLSYGQLVEKASSRKAPQDVELKSPQQFKIIGKSMPRLDTPDKVNGKAIFGCDVRLPGMLTALVARSPVFGGKVKSFDASKARVVPGVRHVVQISSGIAVVADGFWPANVGRQALSIVWDEGPLAGLDSKTQMEQYKEMAQKHGAVAAQHGELSQVMPKAAQKIEAAYTVPYLAHAPMEPLNCVADVRADSCEIWTGTQLQTLDRNMAAKTCGLAPEKVNLHTTLLGGGFGRRAVTDAHFVREAVEVSQAVKAPVKVMWSREDDIQGGYYRPCVYNQVRAVLDKDGMPLTWQHRIVGQSIMIGTPFAGNLQQGGVDPTQVEGVVDLCYDVPYLLVEYHMATAGVPVLWWRSVGHSFTGFVKEGFVDEMAAAAHQDPYQYRRRLLHKHPRYLKVLDLVAEKAGWGKPLPAGHFHGIAIHESFASIVAQVAEVSVASGGVVTVHKVVCSIDCGMVVNPDTVAAQLESCIAFGLSAVLYGAITFKNGRVEQSNFDDYEILRLSAMPKVEVHIVPSEEEPGGVGETGVPPLAPAVANAVFAATGKRIRQLPVRL
jgi:isoquinoline 1-oxidoreductase beta subunit